MSVIRLLLPAQGFAEISLNPKELENQGIAVITIEPNTTEPMNLLALDVVLIDGDSALPDNLDLINQIKGIAPCCKFIVLLSHSSAHALTYMQVGVTGLLRWFPDAAKLAEIIRAIVQGEYYLDQAIAQLLAMRQIKKQLEPFVSLSSREFDVFCLLAEGCSLQTIATQLGISSKTVSNCQTQIKLKLAIDNRDTLTEFANSHGLIMHKGV
ncbi:LuxR C-terminal-related transcriptional regulator [Methylomonas fluvii]|uniref:Response regulator transcription factor n=1 Tax=Methylomonas fluvii TaxID=1854564 RepID=A0ABR9DMY8_9GAMM|nr:response regulator transcription factor [Methylomonas fluvii]MBD9363624.1 response regulator transcription factor [Methylomonas fluvii]